MIKFDIYLYRMIKFYSLMPSCSFCYIFNLQFNHSDNICPYNNPIMLQKLKEKERETIRKASMMLYLQHIKSKL
jgi:hypothetical protein